jgi:hypothetical protein
MPVRRTPINRQQRNNRITPRTVQLFRLLMEEGDQREASVELHQLLGRTPAETNVMDASYPEPPDYITTINDYPGAHALRVELEQYL